MLRCISCGEPKLPEEMGRRRKGHDPRCKVCISTGAATSLNMRRALSWPIETLRRKIVTTENLLGTLRAVLAAREGVEKTKAGLRTRSQ